MLFTKLEPFITIDTNFITDPATYKIIKTEFVRGRTFSSLEELNLELADYVNWFNNHRIHSALGYQTPAEYRKNHLKKVV